MTTLTGTTSTCKQSYSNQAPPQAAPSGELRTSSATQRSVTPNPTDTTTTKTTTSTANTICTCAIAKDYQSIPYEVKNFFHSYVGEQTHDLRDLPDNYVERRWNDMSPSHKNVFLYHKKKAPNASTQPLVPWQIGGTFRESEYCKGLLELYEPNKDFHDIRASEYWDRLTPSGQSQYLPPTKDDQSADETTDSDEDDYSC